MTRLRARFCLRLPYRQSRLHALVACRVTVGELAGIFMAGLGAHRRVLVLMVWPGRCRRIAQGQAGEPLGQTPGQNGKRPRDDQR